MITIKKYTFGEEPEVDEWGLTLTAEQRLELMSQLLSTAWSFAHNEPFPKMDRSAIKYIVPAGEAIHNS